MIYRAVILRKYKTVSINTYSVCQIHYRKQVIDKAPSKDRKFVICTTSKAEFMQTSFSLIVTNQRLKWLPFFVKNLQSFYLKIDFNELYVSLSLRFTACAKKDFMPA
jgi:hypothetical protein